MHSATTRATSLPNCRVKFLSLNQQEESKNMNLHVSLIPILAIFAGILILVIPKALHYIVASFLIIYGLVGILGFNHLALH